jgi:ACS family tartrate transporter-like MFS transporter
MTTDAASDDAVGRSALAKASWRLLPLIALGYGVAYMDRVNISFAALRMNQDLHFSATVYGLGGGLFFLSYAAFEIPSNLFLVRFGARRWIARIMVTWGLLAMGMMFVRTPFQFYAMRFLLGLAEAGFFPGVIYYLTQWFPADHRGRAISRFYVAWPLSSVVMGAVAGALLGLQGRLGLAGWQWLFLVEGLPAVLLSLAFLTLLPDRPEAARWLAANEADWIRRRLAADLARFGPEPHAGFWRALANPRVLELGAMNFLLLGAFYAFNLSAPTVLDGATHLGAARVGYLVALGGVLGAVAMLTNGWHADRTRERYWHLIGPLVLMAAAFAVMGLASAPWLVMGAYLTAITCNAGLGAVFWLLPSDLLHPRATAISVAAINAIGQTGSFFLPYAWGVARDHTGDFRADLLALPVLFLIAAALALHMRSQARAALRTVVLAEAAAS